MQGFEEARDVGAAPTIVFGGRAEEAQAQRAGPEALQQVFAAEDGRKEGEVRERRGVERTRRAALAIPHGLNEAVEGALGWCGIIDDGEGIEIAMEGPSGFSLEASFTDPEIPSSRSTSSMDLP